MTTSTRRRLATLGAATVLATTPLVTAAPSAHAASLICRASMSDATPSQYSNVVVNVKTGKGNANVRTVAQYKTTKTAKSRKSSASGKAGVKYYISGATPGYRVKVEVTVTKDGAKRTCSTSFKPHR